MAKIVPAENHIERDNNGYTAVGIGSYVNNYQALASDSKITLVSPYVSMIGEAQRKCSFRMGLVNDLRTPTQVDHVATVASVDAQPAYLRFLIREAQTGAQFYSPTFKIPDTTFRTMTYSWLLNPFTEAAWQPPQIEGEAYRFGVERIPYFSGAYVVRMFVEPVY